MAKIEWSAEDYKRCADIHYKACLVLKSTLESLPPEQKRFAIHDMYYLSGYIIECLLKFFYLSHNHLLASYSSTDLASRGLKTHSIQSLSQKANESDGIDIQYGKKSALFKNWSEQIRYDSELVLDEELVMDYFINEVEKVRLIVLTTI